MPAITKLNTQAEFDELKNLWLTGTRMEDMAKHFGVSISTVGKKCLQLGLRRNVDPRTLSHRQIIAAYTDQDMTLEEIGAILKCSKDVVGAILKSHGIKMRKRAPRHPGKVKECVALARTGLSYFQIGNRLGLSEIQVLRRVVPVLGNRPKGHYSHVSLEELVGLHKQGLSYREIGIRVGLAKPSIANRLGSYYRKQRNART